MFGSSSPIPWLHEPGRRHRWPPDRDQLPRRSQFCPNRPRQLPTLKTRQHAAWSSGNAAIVGATLQIVGEEAARRSISRPAQRCLMSPPEMAWRASPQHGDGATSPRPTTCRRCWNRTAGAAAEGMRDRVQEAANAGNRSSPNDCSSLHTALSTFCVTSTPNAYRAGAEPTRLSVSRKAKTAWRTGRCKASTDQVF